MLQFRTLFDSFANLAKAARPASSGSSGRSCIRFHTDVSQACKARTRLRIRNVNRLAGAHLQAHQTQGQRRPLALSIPRHVPPTFMQTATNYAVQPPRNDGGGRASDVADAASASTAASVHFSSNTDPATAAPLLARLCTPGGRWAPSSHGRGIERSFKFRTFKKTWEFMDAVAAACRREKHHPEWANVYNLVHIRWTTHRPQGLSMKDLTMAQLCDEQARDFGEEVDEGATPAAAGGKEGDALGELTDFIAQEGCDTCAPKNTNS
ncbi:transcriptional coactivator/pterin dehydratase [Rhizodiscina lignyota]|uniref:4a-hydroxytetrahydrobiopterin dehydratase n=1 Tax=Rhizodiscina lignyota TaxID=1504668 RepID=A0A9P4IFL6_9PEZI|nr:transcriptional coactivator/pterin dehydratase [Rhizodiscina lignyota]